jgi:hypothetical protein
MLGGLWYSRALFGAVWQREAGDTRKPGKGHPARIFGVSCWFALLAAALYGCVMPVPPSAVQAPCPGARRRCRHRRGELRHQLPVRHSQHQAAAHRRGLSHPAVRHLWPGAVALAPMRNAANGSSFLPTADIQGCGAGGTDHPVSRRARRSGPPERTPASGRKLLPEGAQAPRDPLSPSPRCRSGSRG